MKFERDKRKIRKAEKILSFLLHSSKEFAPHFQEKRQQKMDRKVNHEGLLSLEQPLIKVRSLRFPSALRIPSLTSTPGSPRAIPKSIPVVAEIRRKGDSRSIPTSQ